MVLTEFSKMPIRSAVPFFLALLSLPSFAQERPLLLFREDWKEIPAALTVTQEHVSNENLILHLHGPAKDQIKKSHHDQPLDDPYYIWSGNCSGTWALSLEYRDGQIALTGLSKIRWRSKQHGFRVLRLIVQQESGDWLIADQGDEASDDWRIREFNIQDLRWRKLNIETVVEEHVYVSDPDLTGIRKIGFTDLMVGGGSKACSRLDWIEVYGVLKE